MKYLIIIILLFSFNQAMAKGYYVGSRLLGWCEEALNETGSVAIGNSCTAYVVGVFDAHTTLVGWGRMEKTICLPDNVVVGQLVRIVTKYLQERPENLHLSAASQIINAFTAAFPCN